LIRLEKINVIRQISRHAVGDIKIKSDHYTYTNNINEKQNSKLN